MEEETLVLESLMKENIIERRKLLPVWIKVFIWIFMIFGCFAVLGFIGGLFSLKFEAALYGLETNDPISAVGLFILASFLFKGMVAFGLWTEKNWAVDLGIADAILGIAVCATIMFLPLMNHNYDFTFRLELVLLIPYLVKLLNIRERWKHSLVL